MESQNVDLSLMKCRSCSIKLDGDGVFVMLHHLEITQPFE